MTLCLLKSDAYIRPIIYNVATIGFVLIHIDARDRMSGSVFKNASQFIGSKETAFAGDLDQDSLSKSPLMMYVLNMAYY